jgi:hypothetical protein
MALASIAYPAKPGKTRQVENLPHAEVRLVAFGHIQYLYATLAQPAVR